LCNPEVSTENFTWLKMFFYEHKVNYFSKIWCQGFFRPRISERSIFLCWKCIHDFFSIVQWYQSFLYIDCSSTWRALILSFRMIRKRMAAFYSINSLNIHIEKYNFHIEFMNWIKSEARGEWTSVGEYINDCMYISSNFLKQNQIKRQKLGHQHFNLCRRRRMMGYSSNCIDNRSNISVMWYLTTVIWFNECDATD
jgi:hypothetical protein